MKFIPLIGRSLFSIVFIYFSINIFSDSFLFEADSKGIPFSFVLIPLVGVFQIVAALSILLGFMPKYGAWIIAVLLVPITLVMHNFWTIQDPVMRQFSEMTFMRNLSIIGSALIIAYFGAGPYSLDAQKRKFGRKRKLKA